MGLTPEILEITKDNREVLLGFVDRLGTEQKTFRYFVNRPLNAIANHVFTCLAIKDGVPVGYGHLDAEEGVVWLGIVVLNAYQGQGVAKTIMEALLKKGTECGIARIQLAVDADNQNARGLYERFGFRESRKTPNGFIMRKDL